jgi:biofilm PGA synthesis N-glycosyltransferase PgaC
VKNVDYIIVSPVRNEGKHLPDTIRSVAGQTIKPRLWVIVDDGSTDDTSQVVQEAAQKYPWMLLISRRDRGFRQAGSGVMAAFYEGYRFAGPDPWDFLVKLDGDLTFGIDYFESCFQEFRKDPNLGIAGGTVYIKRGDLLEVECKTDPKFHVRGATKIYRRQCWEAIGGLLEAPGWDTMDEVKANMLGWRSSTLSAPRVIHHRPTGAAYGAWKDRVKNGLGCYIVGYHPVFMVVKCLRRMCDKPYFIGGWAMLYGYVKGYANKVARVNDISLIEYFRQQQLNRLLLRKSLWD